MNTMLMEQLRRACGAYMAAPRFRKGDNFKDDLKIEQDEQLAEAAGAVLNEADLKAAYDEYLAYVCSIFDVDRSPSNLIANLPHEAKIREISKILRGKGDKKPKEYKGYTQEFFDEISRRDTDLIKELVGKIQAATPDTAPVSTITERPAFQPIGKFVYDAASLRVADVTVRQATKKKFTSVEGLIQHIQLAEAEIEFLRTSAPAAPIAATELDYEIVERSARDIFAQSVDGTLEPTDLNFTVSVVEWKNARHPKIPKLRPNYIFDKNKLLTLLWAIENGKNIALVGPTGCGKTEATKQIAARLGRPFFRIPVDGQMRKRDLLGGYTQVVKDGASATIWTEGVLEQAMRWPSIVDCDEFDRADPDLAYVAHQLYEGEGLTILEDGARVVMPHPKLAIMATANTKGRTDGMNVYALSQEMSEATRDRFPFWQDYDYMPEEVECRQLLREVPDLDKTTAEKLTKIATMLRAAFKEGTLRTACSYRQVHTCATYSVFLQKMLHQIPEARVRAIKETIVSRGTDDAEVSAMSEVASTVLGAEWRP